MLTQADKKYFESVFATKKDLEGFATKKDLNLVGARLSQVEDTLSRVADSLEKLIFTVEELKQDYQFVVHHSTENFDTNERQDKRLDRIEQHLQLPALLFGK